MTRRTVAAGVAGVALFAGGVVVANQDPGVPSFATETTTVAVLADVPPPIPCTLIRWDGSWLADPCVTQVAAYRQSFRNALGNMSYYPKWKAANPNEYQRMKAYAVAPTTDPQPNAASAFGVVVRWGIEQCRTWAQHLSECAIP